MVQTSRAVSRSAGLQRLRELRGFRPRGVTWREHEAALSELEQVVRTGSAPGYGSCPPFAAVIPIATRPWNATLLCRLLLAIPELQHLVLALNDPSVEAASLGLPKDERLTVLTARERLGPVQRYRALREVTSHFYFSQDDDLFLHPLQVQRLLARLASAPGAPHGFYGQHFDFRRGTFSQGVVRQEGSVHVLNRAYAFTRRQLDRYLALLEDLRVPAHGLGLDDDVLLSFCGSHLPCVVDLGAYADCPSEAEAKVALWGRTDAARIRRDTLERLCREQGLPPASRAIAPRPVWDWRPRRGAALFAPLRGLARLLPGSSR